MEIKTVRPARPDSYEHAFPTAAGIIEDGTGGTASSTWRIDDVTLQLVAVPEPSTWAMLAIGLVALGAAARRRKG